VVMSATCAGASSLNLRLALSTCRMLAKL